MVCAMFFIVWQCGHDISCPYGESLPGNEGALDVAEVLLLSFRQGMQQAATKKELKAKSQ